MGDACYECGKIGHFGRDCPVRAERGGVRGGGGGGGGGGNFEVCFDFQGGRCNRGDACRYSHDGGSTAGRGDGCYECGAQGHFGRDCPVRARNGGRRGPTNGGDGPLGGYGGGFYNRGTDSRGGDSRSRSRGRRRDRDRGRRRRGRSDSRDSRDRGRRRGSRRRRDRSRESDSEDSRDRGRRRRRRDDDDSDDDRSRDDGGSDQDRGSPDASRSSSRHSGRSAEKR